ncbi:MAG: glycerol-3-phosphate dehydrogenase/oxidase [bacterium]
MGDKRELLQNPDVLIIGGGIVGTAILRECATNGLSAVLVERGDFGWDVSAGSTEMAHGGFRYLMSLLDWPLVFESLTERELLSRNAPHLVRHLNFYMPVYVGDGMTFDSCIPMVPKMPITIGKYFGVGMFMMQAGMILYKIFAILGLKAKGFPANTDEVNYKKYNKKTMLEIAPQLNPDRLVGGFRFTDCKIEDVERLVIENVIAADQCSKRSGIPAIAANYTEAIDLKRDGDQKISSVTVRDVESGETTVIKPKMVVNSTGIFIDEICKKAGNGGPNLLRRVSGIHLIVKRFLKSDDKQEAYAFWIDKKILFAISKGADRILVGTTERDIKLEDGNHNRTFSADVDEVVRKLKGRFPEFEFRKGEDLYYTRVRPLMFQPSKSDPKAVSRRDLIKWHDNTPNMVSVSGKLGPARHLAEVTCKTLFSKLKPGAKYTQTHKTPLPGGNLDGSYESFLERQYSAHPNVDRKMMAKIAQRYGSRSDELLEYAKTPEDLAPIGVSPDAVPMCALVFAFEKEYCRHIREAMTRTGNTKFFGEGLDCCEAAARYAGLKLGWDDARISSEIDGYKQFIANRRELV